MSDGFGPETLRGALAEAEPDLRRALMTRATRATTPLVFTIDGQDDEREPLTTLAPGTITFLVAAEDSQVFDRMRGAARAGDARLLDMLATHAVNGMARAVLRTGLVDESEVDEDAGSLDLGAVPSIGEFRYRDRLLGRGMFPTSELDVVVERIVWTGGALDDDAFSFIEHIAGAGAGRLEALVVKSEPVLSDVERAVIDQVPDDSSDMHMRTIGTQAWPVAVVAVAKAGAAAYRGTRVARATLAAMTIGLGCEGHLRTLSAHEFEELVTARDRLLETRSELDMAVSVDSLLDLRQELVARARTS